MDIRINQWGSKLIIVIYDFFSYAYTYATYYTVSLTEQDHKPVYATYIGHRLLQIGSCDQPGRIENAV